jgi:hypothetical protein
MDKMIYTKKLILTIIKKMSSIIDENNNYDICKQYRGKEN